MFGRSHISRSTESSFRTIVSTLRQPLDVTEQITLRQGADPTVSRVLTAVCAAYLATVIQCMCLESNSIALAKLTKLEGSMLLSFSEWDSVATAIGHYFEIQAQEAPQAKKFKATPSLYGLQGKRQAIEDQTYEYDWRQCLLSAAMLLESRESAV